MCLILKKNKKNLELLKQKINGEIKITYKEISNQTGYSKMQLSRLTNEIEKRDINSILVHGLTNKPSNHSAPLIEIDYIKFFFNILPVSYYFICTISINNLFRIDFNKLFIT